MNCVATRNHLLASERLDPPPDEVRGHLVRCSACQAWWRRLVHLEEGIRQLPAPPSPRKRALVQRFREGSPRPAGNGRDLLRFPPAIRPAVPSGQRPRLKERGQQKVAVAFALAATLAAFAIGLWFWPQQPTLSPPASSPDPLARRRAERDRILDGAGPRESVQKLTLLVEELQEEVRRHRTDRERLDEVARFFREVVCEDLLTHARRLSRGEKEKLLPAVTERLRQAESMASRLAADFPASADPLRQIALAAGQGQRLLHELAA